MTRNGAPRDSILLIRTDRVGDLVLSTPAITSFRRSWPAARITAVITGYTEPILRHNPDVDEIVLLPHARPTRAIANVAKLGRDAVLAVGLAPRTDDIFLTGISGAPSRIGYVYRRRYLSRILARICLTDFCLSEADPEIADRVPDRPVMHEVRQVLALVRLAGGEHLTEELTLRLGDDDVAWAEQNAPAGGTVVALAPRWFMPNFGVDAVRKLITRLAQEQADVVVTYGPDTRTLAENISRTMPHKNVTWFGDLPLLRWAAVLKQSATVVTVDTGATHVAAALGRPVVVIFEREYFRLCSQEWGPWRVPSAVFVKPPRGADADPLIEDIGDAVQAL
ncbi:MAG TPA: glycosyltransferase family 9 protein [Candidatus Acidoferrales bacterium]|nr:glycosyltransferase family 9 protein [Candidatus Acidoferrales bacterium]